jgi:hypothetical protein
MPKVSGLQQAPAKLRPFMFHGVEIGPREGYKEAAGTCPFCLKPGKFYVNTESGQWSCKVCGLSGNVPTFLKTLYEQSYNGTSTQALDEFMAHRGYLLPETVLEWGVVRSCISDEWLVPTYGPAKNLVQVNRYVPVHRAGEKSTWRVYVTPDTKMEPYGLHLWDSDKPMVYVCEGPWDAMALWEVLRSAKIEDQEAGTLLYTSAPASSLLASSNVLAVPSCSVFMKEWAPYLRGKHVVFLYDNDYPRKHETTGQQIGLEGYNGTKRAVQILASHPECPASISMMFWGEEGYDINHPSGYDVRDYLKEDEEATPDDPSYEAMARRVKRLQSLLNRVRMVPEEWLGGRTYSAGYSSSLRLESLPCRDWNKLIGYWKLAMKWTEGLDRALSFMLACIASTKAIGDQLWGKVIGPAGCGKSTLCEALSANKTYVLPKSTIRGFHSGFKTDRNGADDHSLITQVANKTLVTKDGDTLLQSPNLKQILSEARDLYDRVSRTHYRHGLSRDYEGVNMTWLLCGTSSLREIDSSELGERFLDCVIMDEINDDLEDAVLRRVFGKSVESSGIVSNGRAESQHTPEMTQVMRATAGFIDYLRDGDNAVGLAKEVEWPDDMRDMVMTLGKFVSYMRARPSERQGSESAEREFAARLVSQFARLASFLCVVMNKASVDAEVMRRVRRTALDTSRGTTLDIVRCIHKAGAEGTDTKRISYAINQTENRTRDLTRFLRQIRAIELFRREVISGMTSQPRWRLTDRMVGLYEDAMGEES